MNAKGREKVQVSPVEFGAFRARVMTTSTNWQKRRRILQDEKMYLCCPAVQNSHRENWTSEVGGKTTLLDLCAEKC